VRPLQDAGRRILPDLHAGAAGQAVAEVHLAGVVDGDGGGVHRIILKILPALESRRVAGEHVEVVAAGARGGDPGVVVGHEKTRRQGRAGETSAVWIDHRTDPLPPGCRVFDDADPEDPGVVQTARHIDVAGVVGLGAYRLRGGPVDDVGEDEVAVRVV